MEERDERMQVNNNSFIDMTITVMSKLKDLTGPK